MKTSELIEKGSSILTKKEAADLINKGVMPQREYHCETWLK